MDETLQLTIKVNKDTGAIELVGTELRNVKDGAEGVQRAFEGMLGPLAELGTIAGVTVLLKEFFKASVDQEEATRQLSIALEMNGVSFDDNKGKIESWTHQAETTTRFTGVEFTQALVRASKATKDLDQAFTLVQTGMGMASASGKPLTEEMGRLATLMTGNQFAMRGLSREYGSFININDTAQEALTKLISRFSDAAEMEKSTAKDLALLKNAWHELSVTIGNEVKPAVDLFARVATTAIHDVEAGLKRIFAFVQYAKENPGAVLKSLIGDPEEANKAFEAFIKKHEEFQTVVTAAAKGAADVRVNVGKQELQEKLKMFQAELGALKFNEEYDLQIKNQTTAQKLQIVSDYYEKEKQLIEHNSELFKNKESEKFALLQKNYQEYLKKKQELEQKSLGDSVELLEKWKDKNLDVNMQLAQMAASVADKIAQDYSNAFAKTIVEGKSLAEQMKAIQMQIEEEIISSLIRIAVQAAITKVAVEGIFVL